MALLGYARVSTLEQDPALQHDALAAAGCVRVFTDRASGALDERVTRSTPARRHASRTTDLTPLGSIGRVGAWTVRDTRR
jgi:hypothetical protein